MARRRSKWDIPASAVADHNEGPKSAADEAREKAAKLTAMLAAKGKLAKNTGAVLPVVKPAIIPAQPLPKLDKEQDLITAEVEINDSPSRIILCKGTTQDEISRYSGSAVSTKGRYIDANEKHLQNEGVRPLYLCVQGTSQDKVDLAVKRIQQIMNGSDIYGKHQTQQTTNQTRWSPYQPPTPPVLNINYPAAIPNTLPMSQGAATQALPTGMHFVQHKVFIGLDSTCSSDFNVKEKLLGPGGSYFQHITTETGAKVFLRGKGSGFLEPTSGKEAFEALHIYISHPKVDGLSAARKLVDNLIHTVTNEYKMFEQMKRAQQAGNPPQPGYPQSIPGYGHPMGYQTPASYPQQPAPPPPPPGMYYGPPPPGHTQPPPAPHGQIIPPHRYPAPPQGPPLPRAHSNGMPMVYPGYNISAPQGPPPRATYAPRPSVPPEVENRPEFQGPPTSLPNPQAPQVNRLPSDKHRYQEQQPPTVPPVPQPEPPKRRFKEVPRSEAAQQPQPRNTQELPRIPEQSSLGNTQDTRTSQRNNGGAMMPPPQTLPKGLMPPPKAQPKPLMATDIKEFKKPIVSTKPFIVPPSPKDVIKQEGSKKGDQSGNIRKHGLSLTSEIPASKKTRKEESNLDVSSSAMKSLVAYDDDDDDSSEEDQEQVSNSSHKNNRSSAQNKPQRLPFWAVGK